MGKTMWMVRAGGGGQLADDFRAKGAIAIGFGDVGDLSKMKDRAAVLRQVEIGSPSRKRGGQITSASQLWRFATEVKTGDRVITYDSSQRIYLIGTVSGDYRYDREVIPPLAHTRKVTWEASPLDRDVLTAPSKNVLGSTLTLFKLPEAVATEIESNVAGTAKPATPGEGGELQDEETIREDVEARSLEFIKDRLDGLDWEEMQELVAGLLRAMGYKTRVSPVGPDRGRDILASPDGFGFQAPRIVVEVKHRNGAMNSQEVRSFLGGRHPDDKGLYVSTGGFTKDARYEADRASIPLMLMDLNDLVLAVVEYYDRMDIDCQRLLPLKKVYWPA